MTMLQFYSIKMKSKNNIDTKPILKNLKKKIKLFAIYGQQNKIFSKKQLNDMKKNSQRTEF